MNLKKAPLTLLVIIFFHMTSVAQSMESYFNKGNNYFAEYQKIKQDDNLNFTESGFSQMDKLLDKAEYNYTKAREMMDYGSSNISGVKNNLKSVNEARKYVETARGVKKSFKKDEENRIDMSDAMRAKERKSYYNNGQLKSIGKYTHTIFDNTEFEIGEWKYYYENGQLAATGKYENGERTSEWKLYYDNGKLRVVGNYENGKQIDEWKNYHENGQLKQIGKFKNGNITGEWKFYDEKGKLINTGNY